MQLHRASHLPHVSTGMRRTAVVRPSVHVHATPASTITAPKPTSFKSDPTFKFSPIINGCWQLAGGHGREVFDNIMEKLDAHADAGFTTFDTADIYGPSEEILGQFQRARADAGKAPVQLFTKYVPNIYNTRVTPAAVEAAVRRSMAKLQVERLDLVQMHWWDYSFPGMVDAALALAELQAKGLVRHVGATNMGTQALQQMVDAGVPLVCNQVQFSLLDRRPLNGMVQYCASQGIKVFAYGPVAGGLLTDKHVGQPNPKAGSLFGGPKYPYVELNTSSLKMYWNVVKQFGGQDLWRDLLLAMRAVAERHPGASVADVALRWLMQQGDGDTVCPIVGVRGTEHIADNLRALSLALSEQDMAQLDAVLARAAGPQGDCYSFERGN